MNRYANITVIGKDKTGVVAQFTNQLFDIRANIEAMEEQVTRGQFSMTIQASWKLPEFDEKLIGQRLRALGRDLGMEIKWWFTDPNRPQRMALMVTKESHCLDTILSELKSGKLKVEIACVIGNHNDLKTKAEKAGLKFHYVSWTHRAKAEEKTLKLLEKANVDFVVLARFMKILSPNFVWRFKNKIINISITITLHGDSKCQEKRMHMRNIFAADAILEAADAGIELIICITEGIPVSDMINVYKYILNKDPTRIYSFYRQ